MKIFADCADLASIRTLAGNPVVSGFTTNPSLLRAAGVSSYRQFALDAIAAVHGLPISFEVLTGDPAKMVAEAWIISGWGQNVYVKIPAITEDGQSNAGIISMLASAGMRLNVTAVISMHHADWVLEALPADAHAIVSVFAGRIADTGLDAECAVSHLVRRFSLKHKNVEILWASTRELWNMRQASRAGCHIITMTKALLDKYALVGRPLDAIAMETVAQFNRDAAASGLSVE